MPHCARLPESEAGLFSEWTVIRLVDFPQIRNRGGTNRDKNCTVPENHRSTKLPIATSDMTSASRLNATGAIHGRPQGLTAQTIILSTAELIVTSALLVCYFSALVSDNDEDLSLNLRTPITCGGSLLLEWKNSPRRPSCSIRVSFFLNVPAAVFGDRLFII